MTSRSTAGGHSPSDDELVAEYVKYAPQIRGWLILRGAPSDYAADIVDDAFLLTRAVIAKGVSVNNVRAYVYRIAERLLAKLWTDLRRQPSAAGLLWDRDEPAEAQARPLDEMVVDGIHVQSLLDALPLRQRDVLTLLYMADLAPRDVAYALGIALNTVYSTKHAALENLRKLMRDASDLGDQS